MIFYFRNTLQTVGCSKSNGDPNVITVPLNATNIPLESGGKLILDKLKTFDKERVAFFEVKSGVSCTYGDLTIRSVNFAKNLKTHGITKNELLVIVSESTHKFWVAALACLYLAAPFYILNPDSSVYELRRYLTMSKPKLVICPARVLPNIQSLKSECTFIQSIIVFENDGSSTDVIQFEKLITGAEDVDFKTEEISDLNNQVAYLINSSGTSGLPKGVMIGHDNLRLNLIHCVNNNLYPTNSSTVFIHLLCFYHILRFDMCFCSIYLGIKSVIMEPRFDVQSFLESIQKHKVTALFIIPIMADYLLNHPLIDAYDISSVKEIYSAGGLLLEPIHQRLIQKFNITKVRQIYSASEIGATVFISPIGSSFKPGSCGKLTPGNSVKIVDINTGKTLGCNERGEICVKSATMKGYLNDPESTRAAYDADGFVRTGDVGYYDEELNFYLVDRIKDIIKFESQQVPPAELEEVLMQHPAIKDAAVVGKPDRRGELAVAFVVKKEGVEVGEQEIVDYVAKFVTDEKRLYGGVRFVEGIPRNSIGKVMRKDLRKVVEEELKK